MASNTPMGAPMSQCDDACRETDAQRERNNAKQFRVGVANQRKRSADRANEIAHQ